MKPLTREWVAKAEGDFATARRELRSRAQAEFRCRLFPRAAVRGEVFEGCAAGKGARDRAKSHDLEALAQAVKPIASRYAMPSGRRFESGEREPRRLEKPGRNGFRNRDIRRRSRSGSSTEL
jgi:hypothetical protein